MSSAFETAIWGVRPFASAAPPSPEAIERMSARTVSRPEVPEVRLLPPEKAYDYEYWARRLIQPELLLRAVAVVIFQAPLLAVPTGAARQGGQLHMGAEIFAQQAA